MSKCLLDAAQTNAHLISNSAHPISHLGQSLLVPSRPFLLDRFYDGEVALEGVECCDGGIVVSWTVL